MTKKYRLYKACKFFFSYATVKLPGGCRRLIPADHVFLATGMKPNRTLYDALKAAGKKVINTGDSLAAGKIYDAIHTGY